MPVPNPKNGYIPKVGEKVRIIGACHPRCLNKIVEVTGVFQEDGEWWFESKHTDDKCEVWYSSGILGGVETVDQSLPVDIFQ